MTSSPERPPPIGLRVSNQKAYVWDVDDIATLRADHHICGTLVGTLPHLSQQNVFLGLPLVLMPEEVVLLVDKGLAVLVDDPSAHLPPTPAQAADFAAARAADIGRQRTDAEVRTAEGATAAGRATSDAAVQKRREREERRAAKRQARAADDGEGVLLGGDNEAGAETAAAVTLARPDTPLTTAATSAGAPYTVSIPASSSSLAWYDPAAATDRAPATHTTLASARAAGIWTYPSDAADRARCAVFRDLWEKHYFMGGGIKFGGDWLVYPGDPLRYHSHFVAQTLTDAPLRPMEIVAHGRLGTATKKAHLLCAWDGERGGAEGPDGAGTVEYWSVEWAGFG